MAPHLTGAHNVSPYLHTVQRHRRRPPGNRVDSQLAAGRTVALTTTPGWVALNMKK